VIGYLKGHVQTVELDSVILVAGGVGYEVTATPATLSEAMPGEALELLIYTQVRDDAIQLYGFRTANEKQLFSSLIKVNGIGPKSAIQILAASTPEQLVHLINEGDARGLSSLPKVGKKTAEQIVLTLKGKLVSASAPMSQVRAGSSRSEIISALVNLGFRLVDVEKVVSPMPADIDLERGIRDGLSALTS
jgi:Holliday junction DNA helicase RuvA